MLIQYFTNINFYFYSISFHFTMRYTVANAHYKKLGPSHHIYMSASLPTMGSDMACHLLDATPPSEPILANCLLRKLPGDMGEIFYESILQLLSPGLHIITGGHRLLYGGH